ncbi:thioredoxin [Pararobbsia silviterrae]|uniref:Thioredoxin n=1 Tax=Pararobbsia silviterrae TaxID=1792498 RepID=A0A494YAW5_9BURK|nr:thioredoxin [Pararobbsia silviterrae]RKP57785.1 thioredoxin [Pararobbsia silviterrae]
MSTIQDLDLGEFEARVTASPVPVLIDFWAPWCAPCKAMAPVLETVSEHFGERVLVLKLDVEAHPDAHERFGVRGIPALILFRRGDEVMRHVGATSKLRLNAMIEPHLGDGVEAVHERG